MLFYTLSVGRCNVSVPHQVGTGGRKWRIISIQVTSFVTTQWGSHDSSSQSLFTHFSLPVPPHLLWDVSMAIQI